MPQLGGNGPKATLTGDEQMPMLDDFYATPKQVARYLNVQAVTSASTVTPTFENDLVAINAQAAALTIANPTGTEQDGWGLLIRIKDNGSSRAITWGSDFRAIATTLPTATDAGKTHYIGAVYNLAAEKWDVLMAEVEA